MITVTRSGQSTAPIVWVSMTPWVPSPITTHVSIPGGRGAGVNFAKGCDNAVTTVKGRCPWTSQGQTAFEALSGSRVTIANGVDIRTGLVTALTVQEQSPAWIYFTMSVTED